MSLQNLTADQIRRAVINTQRQPVNYSARIKQALDNHQRVQKKNREVSRERL